MQVDQIRNLYNISRRPSERRYISKGLCGLAKTSDERRLTILVAI